MYYKNEPVRELKSFQLPQAGASRLEIFDSVASAIFDEQFKEQTPHHPVFSLARQTINSGNLDRYIKGTIAKIINPTESNQDGEAVLTGLGCYKAGELEVDESIYAISILNMMNERESQMVVNQMKFSKCYQIQIKCGGQKIMELMPHLSLWSYLYW